MSVRRTSHALAGLLSAGLLAGQAGSAPGGARPAPAPAGVPSAPGPDWPTWGGRADRTMASPGANPPTDWNYDAGNPANNRNIQWSADLGSKTHGSPVVCGGVVYVGTNNYGKRDPAVTADAGVLMAFRAADGAFLWQRASAKLASGRVNDWPGEGCCSTPCVESQTQRLWYCTNRCEVICLDVADANRAGIGVGPREPKVLWAVDMMRDLGVFPHNMTNCSPAVWGDHVYVITANGVDDTHKHVIAPDAPAIVCFDKGTGRVVWTDNSPGNRVLHGQWSSPTVVEVNGRALVLAALGDGWVYAFDALTGKAAWWFDANPKDSVYPTTRNEIIATPVVVGGKMYIGNCQDPEHGQGPGHFWCVDVTGAGDVSPELDNLAYEPPQPGQELADGRLLSKGVPNPNSKVVWHFGPGWRGAPDGDPEGDRMHRTMSTACVYDERVYIPDFNGYLHCLDAGTGRQYWSDDLECDLWGSVLACDGKLYVGSTQEDLRVYAAGRARKLIGPRDLGGAGVYGTPVYADGTLYVATARKLFAIRKRD